MDISTLICACGALTRTLSVCLDSMTGGMARIYILGRNAPENEPWPDVIGFSIIFFVSVMFMLGLEVINTQAIVHFCVHRVANSNRPNISNRSLFALPFFPLSLGISTEFKGVFIYSAIEPVGHSWHINNDNINSW